MAEIKAIQPRVGGWMSARSIPQIMLTAAVLGVVTGLGQAPFSLLLPALAALVCVFGIFAIGSTILRAIAIGWAFGVGYFAVTLFWIVEPFLIDVARHGWMAPFAVIGMAGGMALFWAVAFGVARWVAGSGKGILALAVFLATAEVTRTYILTGFPWGLIGYIWSETSVFQVVAWIGPHGLTLVSLLVIAAMVQALSGRKNWVLAGVALAAFPLLAAVGAMRLDDLPPVAPDRPVVRLVQPNAAQDLKWDPEMIPVFHNRQLSLTAEASDRKPDLVIWPETAVPYLLEYSAGVFEEIAAVSGGTPVVLGIQRRALQRAYNSLVVLDGQGGVADLYDKHHLVPFGEYIPFGGLTRFLGISSFAARDGYGYSAGPGPQLLDLGKLGRALPLICYEAIFPQDVLAAPERPDWLLQITNDAWFGKLAGPQQHLAQARSRAIEQGLPLLRAANTGVSAVIDARGRILDSLPLGVAGKIDTALPPPDVPTVYSRTGDIPVGLLLISVGLLFCTRRYLNNG